MLSNQPPCLRQCLKTFKIHLYAGSGVHNTERLCIGSIKTDSWPCHSPSVSASWAEQASIHCHTQWSRQRPKLLFHSLFLTLIQVWFDSVQLLLQHTIISAPMLEPRKQGLMHCPQAQTRSKTIKVRCFSPLRHLEEEQNLADGVPDKNLCTICIQTHRSMFLPRGLGGKQSVPAHFLLTN